MIFIGGAVLWSAYLLAWWGWEAMTDRVPAGQPNTFWWPSIRDLISPGRLAHAVPPKVATGSDGPSYEEMAQANQEAVAQGKTPPYITYNGKNEVPNRAPIKGP